MTDHQLPKTRSGEPRAFFGRRSGKKLHGGQQAEFDATLPELEIKLDGALDPRSLFPDAEKLIVEIGYGGGEHLALEASRNPNTGYIGCEVFTGGIGKMVQAINAQGLTNIALYTDDAFKLLLALPDGQPRRSVSALSRSLAQDAAPQAAVRIADDAGRAGAGDPAGRPVPLRQRYRGLCQLDAGAYLAGAGLQLRQPGAGRLAPALSGLAGDAL